MNWPSQVGGATEPARRRPRIAFVFGAPWRDYYSCSPFHWFLFVEHPDVQVLEFDPNQGIGPIMNHLHTGDFTGVVMCEYSAPHFRSLDLPKLVVTDDLHRMYKNYSRQYYSYYDSDGILADYSLTEGIDEFPLSMPEAIRHRTIYHPNYVADAPCFRPHDARLPLSIAGLLHEAAYPLRTRMADRLSDLSPRPTRYELREKFIDILGDYRVSLTDDGRFGYVVAKYFEIPMAGSLLIAPEPHSQIELLMTGFTPENSALIPRDRIYDDNYVETIVRNAIADREGTEIRAKAGQDLVRRRHTVEARVRYLWTILDAMYRGTWSIRDQFEFFLAAEAAPQHESPESSQRLASFAGRLLISVESDYRHSDVDSVIGPNAAKVTIIAPTATTGRRVVSQLAYAKPTVELDWKLSDRTRVERLRSEYDHCLVADSTGIRPAPEVGSQRNWVFGSVDDAARQRDLTLWTDIGQVLSLRFGKALVRVTVDENVDWAHGGINYWLWLSRTHVARVRAEGIMGPSPIVGLLRPDGGSEKLGELAADAISEALGTSLETEQWQAYAVVPDYVAIRESDNRTRADFQAHVGGLIGDLLRLGLDESTESTSIHTPM